MVFKKFKTLTILFLVTWGTDRRMQYRLLLGGFFVLLGSFLNLSFPWCLKFIVDSFDTSHLTKGIIWILALYGILWTFAQVIQYLRQIVVYGEHSKPGAK